MSGHEQIAGGFGRGMVLLALANALYIASAYVITMLVARILGPGEFGAYGIVTGWVSVLTALLVRGLTAGISREMVSGDVDAPTAWRAGVSLGARTSVAFAALGLLAAPVVAAVTGIAEHTVLVAMCATGALTFGTNAVLLSWAMGMHDYARQAWAQVAYASARVALVVGGAWTHGVAGAALGYVAAPLVASVVLAGRRPAAAGDVVDVRRRMAREFIPIGVVSVTVTSFFIVDVFAMSAAGAARTDVGIYVAYAALAHVPFYLLQAASATMVPAIAAGISQVERAAAIRRTMTDTLVLLGGPTLILVTAGDAAARLVFGSAYHAGAPVVAPLAVATAGIAVSAGLVAIAVALKRLRRAMAITALGVGTLAAACAAAARLANANVPTWVAVAACAACVVTAALLAVDAVLHYGGLADLRRSGRGLVVAVVAAAPPLFVADDALRVAVAAACGLAWLAVVMRARIVDVRGGPRDASGVAADPK